MRLLITFGCSWTYGVGVCYTKDMTKDTYEKYAWDEEICNTHSFRGLLSKKYNLENLNFSKGGSSNQRQFRLAKEFFGSSAFDQYRKTYSNIIVIHAITSTARNEFFIVSQNKLMSFKYDYDDKLIQYIAKNTYSHEYEVERLYYEMKFFNRFYSSLGINVLWLDTFNHHNYPNPIDNLILQEQCPRDLLSTMCLRNNINDIDREYHWSSWHNNDTNRIKPLEDLGYLNPYTKHPTMKGHQLIVDVIEEHLGKLI